MSDLRVIQFEKKEEKEYNDLYQELRQIVVKNLEDFSYVEIVGILECLKLEFVDRSVIKPEEF